MTLQTLHNEMVAAWKAGDKFRKDTIADLIGAVKKAAIDAKVKDDIPETLVDQVLLKEKKVAQEMIDTCPADRVETLDQYQARMNIIEEFAPKLIDDPDQLKAMILQLLADNQVEATKKNRGLVMRLISTHYKGKVDMKQVNLIVSNLLV